MWSSKFRLPMKIKQHDSQEKWENITGHPRIQHSSLIKEVGFFSKFFVNLWICILFLFSCFYDNLISYEVNYELTSCSEEYWLEFKEKLSRIVNILSTVCLSLTMFEYHFIWPNQNQQLEIRFSFHYIEQGNFSLGQ